MMDPLEYLRTGQYMEPEQQKTPTWLDYLLRYASGGSAGAGRPGAAGGGPVQRAGGGYGKSGFTSGLQSAAGAAAGQGLASGGISGMLSAL